MRRSLVVALVLCACGETQGPQAHLYTLDEIFDAARSGKELGAIDPRMAVVFPGHEVPLLSPPFAATSAVQGGVDPALTVLPSFAEGQTAAYLVSEVWVGLSKVWLQPEYVFIDAWDEKSPGKHIIPSFKIVFGVEPGGAFYSPYWQTWWVVVPPGTRPDTYKSAADVLNAHLEIHPGGGRYCTLSYSAFALAAPDGATPVRPLSDEAVGKPLVTTGWANGKAVHVLDLGNDRFTWDEYGVINDAPLYVPARKGHDGVVRPLGLPSIGGTGPLGSHTPADAPGGRPRYGALWHLYQVVIPDSAAVFIPSALPDLRARLTDTGILAPVPGGAAEEANVSGIYTGRIALHPDCFAAATFPEGCGFLDNDEAVENMPRAAVVETDTWASCPFIRYGNAAVNP